jgi:hypothetical protein
MTIETAKTVSQFLKNNEVHSINVMGGEIFCNPNWREILDLIIPQVKYVRIVSNGDWVVGEPSFGEYFTKFKNCYVSISKDQWHNMINVEKAIEILTDLNIPVTTPDSDEKEMNLVPIGRSQFSMSLYSMMGCYCHNPEHQYSFLIDEIGDIFKCGFGVWNYADVDEYVDGGFPARFKEFNKKFYDVFIPSCKSCIRCHDHSIKNPVE